MYKRLINDYNKHIACGDKRLMNTITINEALSLLQNSKPQPFLNFDAITEMKGDDHFGVCLNGALAVKHANGGQIESTFYVDLALIKDQWKVIVSDVFNIDVKGLIILDSHGATSSINDHDEFGEKLSPVLNRTKQEVRDLETEFLSEIQNHFNGKLTVDAIKGHPNYQ